MVKLKGKALGIVQLVNKGEGLEAWHQLKLEYEGKSGNRQAALFRGILNLRAAWDADTRDGRLVLELLNRWEKTIGLYRTASGVDISDGILATTALEHAPESYQNILKPLPMCEHRTAQCVAGYVSMLRRCGDTTLPLDLLRTKPNLLDRCRWTSIRLQQCQVSRLARTGQGSRRERARARMARTKARARKVTRARIRSRYPNLSSSKDTPGIATYGDMSVPTARNASPTPSRRVVRQRPLLTMMETSQP